jgi:antitoxin ParD1/3/4
MAVASINISIPTSMKTEVEKVIKAEGYGNTSEFFRDLVRDYLERRTERKLETLILEGLATGKATQFKKGDIDSIRRRGLARLKNKRRR